MYDWQQERSFIVDKLLDEDDIITYSRTSALFPFFSAAVFRTFFGGGLASISSSVSEGGAKSSYPANNIAQQDHHISVSVSIPYDSLMSSRAHSC